MRFVAVKTADQQNALVLHRMRTGFVEERTALINRLRGELAEFGVFMPQGIEAFRAHFPDALEDGTTELNGIARTALRAGWEQFSEMTFYCRIVDIFAPYGWQGSASGAARKCAHSNIKVDDKGLIWASDDRNGRDPLTCAAAGFFAASTVLNCLARHREGSVVNWMTRLLKNARTEPEAPKPLSEAAVQGTQETAATNALLRAMESTLRQRHSDGLATYRRLTAELATHQANAALFATWRRQISEQRELLRALEPEAELMTYLLNRYAMVDGRYYRTLSAIEQAELLRTALPEESAGVACDRQEPAVPRDLLDTSFRTDSQAGEAGSLSTEELERTNAQLAQQCATVTAGMLADASAEELEREITALQHSVELKQSETRALKSMFFKYGAIRGIWLGKMSERERRDVFLKGARDLARAKLDQARAAEREAQANSLKPAGSELPPAVEENGKPYLRTRPKAGWREKASGDMVESKPVDSLFAGWSDAQGRVSPVHVADKLAIKRRAAKKILQDAAQRGVLVALPNGWYEVASRQPPT
jgi:hypothetical protein